MTQTIVLTEPSTLHLTLQAPEKETPTPPLMQERQVKILDNTPVKGGIYSYGEPLGFITSIVIAILTLLHLIPPCHSLISRVTDKIRTHKEEIDEASEMLAKNSLKALQEALPAPIPKTDYRLYLKGIFGSEDHHTLMQAEVPPDTIHDEIERLIPLFGAENWEEQIRSELQGAFKDQTFETPSVFLREARKVPELQVKVAFLSLAQMHYEGSKIEKILEKGMSGLTPEERAALDKLASQAVEKRQLDSFLKAKKIVKKENYDAALAYLTFHVDRVRDESFFNHMERVTEAIQNPPESNLASHLQKEVREPLDQMIQSRLYQDLLQRHGRESPLVVFVQDLTFALRIESQGMDELGKLGGLYLSKVKEERGEVPEEGQCTFLADAMDDTIKKHHWSYKIESFFDKLHVLARYPEKTVMAYISHKPDTALDYNSYKIGNHDLAYGTYRFGERQMHAILGPTPTGDSTLLAQLDGMKESGGIHLQHNLEHPEFSKGDLTRIQYLLELEKQYPGTFRLFSTPLDGRAWWLSGEVGKYFTTYSSSEEFYRKFATYAFTNDTSKPVGSFDQLQGSAHRRMEGAGDNGFYIGQDVMSDRQFRLAFEHAAKAFSAVDPKLTKHPKRLTRALQVGVEGFLAVGAIVKTLDDLPNKAVQDAMMEATFGQACKLDIDRGIVMNVMTRVYFHLISGENLSEESIKEIIGTVIGRAEMVSGRTIISSRYQPLSDALRLIGQNETAVKNALRNYMHQGYRVNFPREVSFQSSS